MGRSIPDRLPVVVDGRPIERTYSEANRSVRFTVETGPRGRPSTAAPRLGDLVRRLLSMLVVTVGVTAGLLPLAAPPALAACPAPGGGTLPPLPEVRADFVVAGRGWGHGVGMSQHGAQGAALLGCSADEILRTYYRGATVETQNVERPVLVGLVSRTDVISVRVVTGEVVWQIEDPEREWAELPRRQPQGATWRARWDRARQIYRVEDQDGALVWEGGTAARRLRAQLGNGAATRVALPAKSNRQYAHGNLEFLGRTGDEPMSLSVRVPTMNQYLYGLAEMPSSWESAALQAQAITGRSYAASRRNVRADCRCELVDTPADQVYAGYDKEAESGFGHRWVAAVDATPNRVLWHDGRLATGFYSSSHGGQSESNAFSSFFGGPAVPYLQPVDDSRWEQEAVRAGLGRGNPNDPNDSVHAWARGYSRAQMTSALSSLPVDGSSSRTIGRVRTVTTPNPKGAGGRIGHPGRDYGGVRVEGEHGVATISGLEFLNRLAAANLAVPRRSELFTVRFDPDLACTPIADQSGNTVVTRSSGPGRVDTAAQVSADHWDAAEDVVLATAGGQDDGYADALSAAALAASLDAPLLLTPADQLLQPVRDELQRLGAQRVRIMGGAAAISAGVEEALRRDGYETSRVAGPGRFDTARAAALAAGASPSGDVALALGTNWPDAVSAGSLAGSPDRVPTLLTTSDAVPDVTLRALGELEAERVVLIGGSGVIRDAVAQQLRAEGYEVDRLSGANRFGTSVAVVRDALGRADDGDRPVLLASGEAFPDALAAGALSARVGGPVVLVPSCNLDPVPETVELLREGPFDGGILVGGRAAVSDRVREQATDAVGG
jgi:SpoIID/LytB domain protein